MCFCWDLVLLYYLFGAIVVFDLVLVILLLLLCVCIWVCHLRWDFLDL